MICNRSDRLFYNRKSMAKLMEWVSYLNLVAQLHSGPQCGTFRTFSEYVQKTIFPYSIKLWKVASSFLTYLLQVA